MGRLIGRERKSCCTRIPYNLAPGGHPVGANQAAHGECLCESCRYKVVKKKGRKAVDDVAELLLSFADKRTGQIPCGIVYCLSRKETEDLAAQLSKIRQPNGRSLTVR